MRNAPPRKPIPQKYFLIHQSETHISLLRYQHIHSITHDTPVNATLDFFESPPFHKFPEYGV